MEVTLKDKFLISVLSPFNFLLKLTGVFVIVPESKLKRRLFNFWSYFLLTLCIQANLYVFLRRNNIVNLYQEMNIDKLIREITNILIRLTSTVINIVTHANLIYTISLTIDPFLKSLESVDCNLKRPKFSSSLKHLSFFGAVYLLFTLYANWLFNIYWEIFHPTHPVEWLVIIQNTIRILSNQWFAVLPVWIFAICGELIVFYTEQIALNLKLIAQANRPSESEQTFEILRSLKQLHYASDMLHRRFSTMLMANCCLSFVIMLTSSFYIIEFLSDTYIVVSCWEGTDILDSFIRFCVMCHTADRMRGSTTECISVLRQLRDKFHCYNEFAQPFNECTKVTFYLIEIAEKNKNVNRQKLFQMLPLNKHLILPTTQTIFTFLIIIYQFKNLPTV